MGCQCSSEEKKTIQTIHYTNKNNNLQINQNNIISLTKVNKISLSKKSKSVDHIKQRKTQKKEETLIEEILTNEINKAMKIIINDDIEVKLQIDFILNEGSFKFTKYFNEQKITEGFEFQYKGFFFSTKQGESFNEFNLHLDKINVYLFNIINNNIISIPITYKFLE